MGSDSVLANQPVRMLQKSAARVNGGSIEMQAKTLVAIRNL
jgi:hypothetical protein